MRTITRCGGIFFGLCALLCGCSQKMPVSSAAEKPIRIVMGEQVPPGYRGIALPLPTWEAQFIAPGNRIDVIMTFDKDHPARLKEKTGEKTGQTLLQNVLVLDVRPPVRDGDPSALELALNPNEAQYLALAIDETRLHIALRNNKDIEMHPMEIIGMRKLFR